MAPILNPLLPAFSAAALLIVGLFEPANAEAPKSQPTVILLTTDDLNWDSVGAYGSRVENPTPNIDLLAKDSTRFEYGFAQVSVCTPSRHVMLTGCYSHTTKTEGFVDVTAVAKTLPEILKNAGYYTAIINKGVGDYHWDFQADRQETLHGRDPSLYAKYVRQLVEQSRAKGKPLFLMANTMDPHRPFHNSAEQMEWDEISKILPKLKTASKVYASDEVEAPSFLPDLQEVRQEMAEYYSSVRRADDVVGAIMATLRDLGIENDVMLVFLSDHGISLPFAKANVYRESLRVPFLVKLPGNEKAGQVIEDTLASAVDIAPTVLDFLGMSVPEKMEGTSLKKVIRGDKGGEAFSHVYGYYYQDTNPDRTPMFTVQDKRFGYIVNLHYGTGKRVETSDYGNSATWKAMTKAAKNDPAVKARVDFYRQRELEELYDYQKDPHALKNLIDDPAYADVRKRLSAKLEKWMEATKCDALEAFRNRTDLATRKAYVRSEDAKSLERGGGPSARPVKYGTEKFNGKSATWSVAENNGLFPIQAPDGGFESIEISGKKALHSLPPKRKQENVFLYFHAHDGFTDTDRLSYGLRARIILLDRTPGTVQFQYNGLRSKYADSPEQKLTGDGKWMTLEFRLSEVRFDNSQHGGADFRVAGKNGAELFLNKVELIRGF